MAKSTPKLHDTSRRVKLTRDAARRADCLRDAKGNYVRQRVYWDTDNKGFGLVANKESKTWIAQARVNGVPKRITIGQYGDSWTVDKARKEAAELLASMRKGNDPTAGDPDSVTLGEAWEVFKEALHAEGAAPKTLRRYEHCVTHYLKTWLPRPLASITRRRATPTPRTRQGDRRG